MTSSNKVLYHLSQNCPNISRLTYGNIPDFIVKRPTVITYSNSHLYALRASRLENGSLGYKYIDNNLKFLLGYRNSTFYLSHIKIQGVYKETLRKVCLYIQDYYPNQEIVIKKCEPMLANELLNSNIFYDEDSTQDRLYEDECFPEHYLDLSITASSDLSILDKNLRSKIRRFSKDKNTALRLMTSLHDSINTRLSTYFSSIAQSDVEKFNTYKLMLRELSLRNASIYYYGLFLDSHDKAHGFYIAEKLSQSKLGLYCALSSTIAPGITEWMDYQFFRYLHSLGYQYIYLGGSETLGVHNYIQKLSPKSPSYKEYSLRYIGSTFK